MDVIEKIIDLVIKIVELATAITLYKVSKKD